MNRKPARRSSLFLLELIIAILFFCLAATVCIRFFVASHLLSVETRSLNMAVNQTAATAELLRSEGDFASLCQELYPDCDMDASGGTIYYNDDWEPCSQSEGSYCLTIAITADGASRDATFEMTDLASGASLYDLSLGTYGTGEEAGH